MIVARITYYIVYFAYIVVNYLICLLIHNSPIIINYSLNILSNFSSIGLNELRLTFSKVAMPIEYLLKLA